MDARLRNTILLRLGLVALGLATLAGLILLLLLLGWSLLLPVHPDAVGEDAAAAASAGTAPSCASRARAASTSASSPGGCRGGGSAIRRWRTPSISRAKAAFPGATRCRARCGTWRCFR